MTQQNQTPYAFIPARECRCIYCGWIVSAEGVTIPPEIDIAYDENAPERCSDSACKSYEGWHP